MCGCEVEGVGFLGTVQDAVDISVKHRSKYVLKITCMGGLKGVTHSLKLNFYDKCCTPTGNTKGYRLKAALGNATYKVCYNNNV